MTPRAHERFRARLWSKVYVQFITAQYRSPFDSAESIADKAVEEFDKRFKATEQVRT